MRVYGPRLRELDHHGDAVAELIGRRLRYVSQRVAREFQTINDVNVARSYWAVIVDMALLPAVETAWTESVDNTYEQLNRQLGDDAVTAALSFPKVVLDVAEAWLARARNRLIGVGDLLWSTMRAQLTEGMSLGESVPQLRDRLIESADLTVKRAESVARTEVIGASNAGSFYQMKATGLRATKEWLAANDDRTRASHRAVDGTVVDMDEKFTVGGWPLDFPHDPTAPPEETINCRCTLAWDIPEEDAVDLPVEASLAAAARSDKTDGAMIALIPTDADAERLAVPGFEPPDELHLTLWYLGDAVDVSDEQLEELIVGALEAVSDWNPIEGNAFGAALWNPKSDYPAWVLNVGDARDATTEAGDESSLVTIRDEIGEIVPFDLPEQYTPWQPHVCIAYANGELGKLGNELIARLGSVTFDRIRIAVGENVIDIPLGEDESDELIAGAVAFHMQGKHDQSTHGHGDGGGDGKSGGKSLKAGKPLKVTHALIHKNHEPDTTIAVTKDGNDRVRWTGKQYNIEQKTPDGGWKVNSSTKKSHTYKKMQELGLDWYEPEVDDSGNDSDSTSTDSSPATTPAIDDSGVGPDSDDDPDNDTVLSVQPIETKSLRGYKKVGNGPFTIPNGKYEDSDGAGWVVVAHASDDRARNEVLANRLYELTDTNVPGVNFVKLSEVNFPHSGETLGTIASAPVGTTDVLQKLNNTTIKNQLHTNFAVDAWLGNWDVVGAGGSNISLDSENNVTRLSAHGSLLYRAQGQPKGAAFSDTVSEIDTLRDPSTNPNSAAVFKDVTEDQIRAGVKKIAAIHPEQIDTLVDEAGFTGETADKLKKTLKARRQDLIKRFGDNAPTGSLKPMGSPSTPPTPTPTPTPAPTPTAPSSTPTPPGPSTPNAPTGPKIYSAAEKTQVQKIFASNNVKWHNDTKKIYDSALEVSKTYPGLTMGDALDIMDQSLKKKTGNPFRTKVEKFLKTNAGKQYALAQGGPGGIGTTSSTGTGSSSVSPSAGVPTSSSAYTPLSAQQANAMQKEMDEQTPPPWTGPQKHALRDYTGSNYTAINKCLRGTGPCTPALEKTIKGIRGGMKPSTRDIVVYRKTNAATFGLTSAKQLDDMVGKVIKDDGVVSTSIFQGTWSGQIQMIIEAPKGSKMAWVAPISKHPHENEIVVSPGTHFEIIEVTAGSGYTERTIRLRIIPGSDSA